MGVLVHERRFEVRFLELGLAQAVGGIGRQQRDFSVRPFDGAPEDGLDPRDGGVHLGHQGPVPLLVFGRGVDGAPLLVVQALPRGLVAFPSRGEAAHLVGELGAEFLVGDVPRADVPQRVERTRPGVARARRRAGSAGGGGGRVGGHAVLLNGCGGLVGGCGAVRQSRSYWTRMVRVGALLQLGHAPSSGQVGSGGRPPART